jgi:hypothetical protein
MTALDAIRSKYSMNQVTRFYYEGRISDREYNRFCGAWLWGAAHLASMEHDRFYALHGKDAYYRRINRMRRALGAPEYLVP